MTAAARPFIVIAQAGIAVAAMVPRIIHAVARAEPTDHDQALRQLREAQKHTRDLLTRLEIAELEFAATGSKPGKNAA